MHRNGSGDQFPDIATEAAKWRATGCSPATYTNEKEWQDWQEDFGELTHTYPNGSELRRHATIKSRTRGGRAKIVHNITIVKTPDGTCTHYSDKHHDKLLEHAQTVS